MFNVHNDASDKHLVFVISQNNKPIAFLLSALSLLLSRSRNPLHNYTTIEKEILSIV